MKTILNDIFLALMIAVVVLAICVYLKQLHIDDIEQRTSYHQNDNSKDIYSQIENDIEIMESDLERIETKLKEKNE